MVLRVCRDWRRAAHKERTRDVGIKLNNDLLLRMCNSTSPLKRHVAQITWNTDDVMTHQMLNALPHLPKRAEMTVVISYAAAWLLRIPCTVTHLRLLAHNHDVSIVAQFDSLQTIYTSRGYFKSDTLHALCAWGNMQHLQQISLHETVIGAVEMSALVTLPALTSIEPNALELSAYSFLPKVRQLQRLRVNFSCYLYDWSSTPDASVYTALLAECQSLTHLTLSTYGFDSIQDGLGSNLIRAFPKLQSLHLFRTNVGPLDFIQRMTSLQRLHLDLCYNVSVHDLMRLNSLAPRLIELRMDQCCRNMIFPLVFNKKQWNALQYVQTLHYTKNTDVMFALALIGSFICFIVIHLVWPAVSGAFI